MKAFFESEVEAVSKRIQKYLTDGCFSFSLFADVHTSNGNKDDGPDCGFRMVDTLETMKKVHEQCDIDGLFFLGDSVLVYYKEDSYFSPKYWTEQRVSWVLNYLSKSMGEVNKNAFLIAGNHDGVGAGFPEPKFFYDNAVKNINPNCKISKVKDKGYYYADYPEKKVRCICLMCGYTDENGQTVTRYTIDQIKWLYEEALNVPEGTNIFLFTHYPPFCHHPKELRENLVNLLEAYHNKNSVEICGEMFDCTNAKGNVKAIFVGDGHYDWINRTDFFCPIIEIACSLGHEPTHKPAGWWMPEEATSPKRYRGTPTEVIWDTVIFNPEDNDLVLIRFGAGTDRYCKL